MSLPNETHALQVFNLLMAQVVKERVVVSWSASIWYRNYVAAVHPCLNVTMEVS